MAGEYSGEFSAKVFNGESRLIELGVPAGRSGGMIDLGPWGTLVEHGGMLNAQSGRKSNGGHFVGRDSEPTS